MLWIGFEVLLVWERHPQGVFTPVIPSIGVVGKVVAHFLKKTLLWIVLPLALETVLVADHSIRAERRIRLPLLVFFGCKSQQSMAGSALCRVRDALITHQFELFELVLLDGSARPDQIEVS